MMKQKLCKFSIIVLLMVAGCATVPSDNADDADNVAEAGNAAAADNSEAGDFETEDYRQSIIVLLETFDGILTSAELGNELTEVYNAIRPAFSADKIRVLPDLGEFKNSLERSQVRVDGSRVAISLHESLLQDIETNPVPALGEFASELPFVAAFLQHGADIVELYQDPIEFYLSRMDSLYLQTIFLRDFALPLYGEEAMGPYENYLLQGLAVDNFNSLSLFVFGIDRNIIYSMLGLSRQVAEVGRKAYLAEVLQLGQDIRDNLEQSRRLFAESGEAEGDDGEIARRSMYIALSSANTYRTLGSLIFSAVVNNQIAETKDANSDAVILEINQLYNLLELLIGEADEFRKNYQQQYLLDF